VVERLNVASRWRGAVLLAVLLCAFAVAHPMTAHAARMTPTRAHSVTARASGAIYFPYCNTCGHTSAMVRATSSHSGERPSARGRARSGGSQTHQFGGRRLILHG
jgi:hypothetical protein